MASAVGEDEVLFNSVTVLGIDPCPSYLVRVELEEDILFVVVIELNTVLNQIFGSDGDFFLHLKTVRLVCKVSTDALHTHQP